MKFETDSYFSIGKSHLNGGTPCQDYALSEKIGDAAFAVISDGCSSAGKTDIGSRLLVLATSRTIRRHWNLCQEISKSRGLANDTWHSIALQQQLVNDWQAMLGLTHDDLLATCLYAYISPTYGYVHIQGDGVIAFVSKTDIIKMTKFEWEEVPLVGSVPFYPAYIADKYKGFIKAHGGIEEDLKFKATTFTGELLNMEIMYSIKEGILGINFEVPKDTAYVAIFSDGIGQIEGMTWQEATKAALAFKTNAGDFVKRRMSRIVRDLQSEGKNPIDDISCAVIQIIENEANAE